MVDRRNKSSTTHFYNTVRVEPGSPKKRKQKNNAAVQCQRPAEVAKIKDVTWAVIEDDTHDTNGMAYQNHWHNALAELWKESAELKEKDKKRIVIDNVLIDMSKVVPTFKVSTDIVCA